MGYQNLQGEHRTFAEISSAKGRVSGGNNTALNICRLEPLDSCRGRYKRMAVYHLKVSIGSRAGGQSARAKADYIEREGRYEPDREELEHRESGNMPEWAKEDPRSYWEAADEHERANGSLCREIQFALPRELNEP